MCRTTWVRPKKRVLAFEPIDSVQTYTKCNAWCRPGARPGAGAGFRAEPGTCKRTRDVEPSWCRPGAWCGCRLMPGVLVPGAGAWCVLVRSAKHPWRVPGASWCRPGAGAGVLVPGVVLVRPGAGLAPQCGCLVPGAWFRPIGQREQSWCVLVRVLVRVLVPGASWCRPGAAGASWCRPGAIGTGAAGAWCGCGGCRPGARPGASWCGCGGCRGKSRRRLKSRAGAKGAGVNGCGGCGGCGCWPKRGRIDNSRRCDQIARPIDAEIEAMPIADDFAGVSGHDWCPGYGCLVSSWCVLVPGVVLATANAPGRVSVRPGASWCLVRGHLAVLIGFKVSAPLPSFPFTRDHP
jgi:hypothetical protein